MTTEFQSILTDFSNDMRRSFPEFGAVIDAWESMPIADIQTHCRQFVVPLFFDILYSNKDIFGEASQHNTEFLPGLDFKQMWNAPNVSNTIHTTMWKYLQLFSMSVIHQCDDADVFGNSAALFGLLDKNELKTQLETTLQGINEFFNESPPAAASSSSSSAESSSPTAPNIPSADDIHSHLNNLLDGKIGQFAAELAQEFSKEIEADPDMNIHTSADLVQHILKNPAKIMSLMGKINDKIKEKIDSGEMTQNEMITESVNMLRKLKHIPGMEHMTKKMFDGMNFQAAAKKYEQAQKTKDRMKSKLNKRKNAKQAKTAASSSATTAPSMSALSDDELVRMFNQEFDKAVKGKK